jgi:hypothetical protein
MATRELGDDPPDRPVTTGYLYSGMAIAGVHAVGRRLSDDKLVKY